MSALLLTFHARIGERFLRRSWPKTKRNQPGFSETARQRYNHSLQALQRSGSESGEAGDRDGCYKKQNFTARQSARSALAAKQAILLPSFRGTGIPPASKKVSLFLINEGNF